MGFRALHCALPPAHKFGCSPCSLPRPTRDGQKAKHALWAAGLGAAACPPRRWLGRTGRNSRPGCGVSQPSPGARLPVPRGGRVGVLTQGSSWDLRHPPAKGSVVPLPRISPMSRQFSVLICEHPSGSPQAPQHRPGPRVVSLTPTGAGPTRLPREPYRGAVTPLINLPVAATCAGESRRGA